MTRSEEIQLMRAAKENAQAIEFLKTQLEALSRVIKILEKGLKSVRTKERIPVDE